MIIRFDQNGIITFANSAYANRLGLTREEVIGRCCFDTIHPDHREDAARRVFSCTPERPTVPGDTIRVASAGGRWDWVNGMAVGSTMPRELCWATRRGRQCHQFDRSPAATARKRIAVSLHRRGPKPNLIMRFDTSGKLEFANTAFMHANNLAPDEVSTTSIWEYIQPEDHARVRAAVEGLTPKQPTERLRLRIVRSGVDFGKIVWTRVV